MSEDSYDVGLYGSSGLASPWRSMAAKKLVEAGLSVFDPTTSEWDGITAENGDANQEKIDGLVARELDALSRCDCVIWAIDDSLSLASRFELGYLAGVGVQTFCVIPDNAVGRNYLRAAIKALGDLMAPCVSLEDAASKAIAYVNNGVY